MSTSYSELTTAEISDLEVGKTYYFSAISVDENAEES
jgi:YHS domain-containing protein